MKTIAPDLVDQIVSVEWGLADGEQRTLLVGITKFSDRARTIVREIVKQEAPDVEVDLVEIRARAIAKRA